MLYLKVLLAFSFYIIYEKDSPIKQPLEWLEWTGMKKPGVKIKQMCQQIKFSRPQFPDLNRQGVWPGSKVSFNSNIQWILTHFLNTINIFLNKDIKQKLLKSFKIKTITWYAFRSILLLKHTQSLLVLQKSGKWRGGGGGCPIVPVIFVSLSASHIWCTFFFYMKRCFCLKDNSGKNLERCSNSTTMFVYTKPVQLFCSKYVNMFLA